MFSRAGLAKPCHGWAPAFGESPSTMAPTCSRENSHSQRPPGSPGSILFQKHTAKSPGKLAALCFSLETSFHVLRQWNSLFAIQINITSLITLFIKSVCRKMRLQSRTSQAPQTSVPTATPDPNPSQMVNINREADGDEDLIKPSKSCNSRDKCEEAVILLTPFVFLLPAVSR